MAQQVIKKKWADLIGAGYGEFFRTRKRYRVLKGGRASKKSTTTAQDMIYKIMRYPLAHGLVVRNTFNTHKDSTFALLQWATSNMGVANDWKFTQNPLEATYTPTGQKILFRGFDDPLKLTSIAVPFGHICFVWLEECYEIENEKDFQTLDESIRGQLPEGYYHQITLTYNPWVNSHWTKQRFWDNEDPNAFTLTTTYKCNEWLSDTDRELIERLQTTDPERYRVVGLGEYGIPGGAFFEEFRKDIHVCESFLIPSNWRRYTSTDYGLDMLATLWFAVNPENQVFVYKELHQPNLIISEAAKKCTEVNNNDLIFMRYGPPDLWNRRQETGQSAAELFQANGWTMAKSNNSREIGWLAVKELLKTYQTRDIFTGEEKTTAKIQIFSNCKTLINYLPQLQRDEKNPNDVANEPHYLTHIADALRGFCVERYYPSKAVQQQSQSMVDEFMGKPQTSQTVYMNW